jgi:uncharacterized protein YciI
VHYVLSYTYVEEMAERRVPFREEHLARARAAHERGELVLAGAYGDSPAGAVLIFRTEDPSMVEAFVNNDPYFLNDLVVSWKVRPLTVVFGG